MALLLESMHILFTDFGTDSVGDHATTTNENYASKADDD